MASKKHIAALNKRIVQVLKDAGAVETGKHYPYSVQTIAGELLVSIQSVETKWHSFHIHTRFPDYEKANLLLKNKIDVGDSGKWNTYAYDADELLREFVKGLSQIRIPITIDTLKEKATHCNTKKEFFIYVQSESLALLNLCIPNYNPTPIDLLNQWDIDNGNLEDKGRLGKFSSRTWPVILIDFYNKFHSIKQTA